MVFEAGGHRTIRQHVRCWEKFEDWAVGQGHSVYPPTAPVITRYALHLQDQGCGPAVIPAMRYGVSWVCKRLAMAVPEGADQQIQAISEQVYQARGRELKEASPVPPKLVMALEIMVETCAKVRKPALALLSWWALILIYASLRFDDGVHVAPLSLQITEDALYGVVWQTKVERKRRGTRFAAPRCSLSGIDWLKIGWELFAPFRTDRDFFIWDLKTDVEFTEAPVTYTRGLAWLKHTLMKGVSQLVVAGKAGVNEAAELEAAVRPVTWHSMRVGQCGRQGRRTSGQLEGSQTARLKVRPPAQRALSRHGQEGGGAAPRSVDARPRRVPGRGRGRGGWGCPPGRVHRPQVAPQDGRR